MCPREREGTDLSHVVHRSRPLEQKDSVLVSVTCISGSGEEKNCPHSGAGAEPLVSSAAAVKQVSAAGVWCSCGHVHSGGGSSRRFLPVRVVLSAAGLRIIRARICVLMNPQWLRKQNFVEEFLPSCNCGKEPLKILEKPGGSPFPQRGVFSFTADWPAHMASSFTHQVLLLLWLAGNHFSSVHRDTCLVFLNLSVERSFYFPLSRLSSLAGGSAAVVLSRGEGQSDVPRAGFSKTCSTRQLLGYVVHGSTYLDNIPLTHYLALHLLIETESRICGTTAPRSHTPVVSSSRARPPLHKARFDTGP